MWVIRKIDFNWFAKMDPASYFSRLRGTIVNRSIKHLYNRKSNESTKYLEMYYNMGTEIIFNAPVQGIWNIFAEYVGLAKTNKYFQFMHHKRLDKSRAMRRLRNESNVIFKNAIGSIWMNKRYKKGVATNQFIYSYSQYDLNKFIIKAVATKAIFIGIAGAIAIELLKSRTLDEEVEGL
jgi:hypothetical protein